VTLWFDGYELTRYRKDKAMGSGLVLIEGKNDRTKGTVKETQKLLEEIIKISELTFVKSTHFGQGDVKPFARLTDKELKEVFEQALGLTFFTGALANTKSKKSAALSRIVERQQYRERLEREQAHVEEKIEYLAKAAKEFEANKLKEKERIGREIQKLRDEQETIKADYTKASAQSEEWRAKVVPIELKIKELQYLKYKLEKEHAEKLEGLVVLQTQMRAKLDEIKEMEKELADADGRAGQDCVECGRVFTGDDIAKLVRALNDKIDRWRGILVGLEARVMTRKAKVSNLKKIGEPLEEKLRELTTEMADFRIFKAEYEPKMKMWERRVNEIQKQVGDWDTFLKNLETSKFAHDGDIKETTKRDFKIMGEIDGAKLELDKLQGELELIDMLAEILGNGGLKSYIFDSITPELNRLINGYLQMLDDIEVEVSTVTKLKSGDYREKFHINVENRHGSNKFAGNSGGEQAKINLAIALGFNKLVRSMAESPVNVCFLDEPFESLDDGSSEKVLELCETFDAENVFLITHNQGIKDLVPNVVTVEKTGGKATVKS